LTADTPAEATAAPAALQRRWWNGRQALDQRRPRRIARLGRDGALAVAEPKALRYRLLHVAGRVVRHARRLVLRLQASWPWAAELARAFARLRALPLRC
jgi:hypothetical protein